MNYDNESSSDDQTIKTSKSTDSVSGMSYSMHIDSEQFKLMRRKYTTTHTPTLTKVKNINTDDIIIKTEVNDENEEKSDDSYSFDVNEIMETMDENEQISRIKLKTSIMNAIKTEYVSENNKINPNIVHEDDIYFDISDDDTEKEHDLIKKIDPIQKNIPIINPSDINPERIHDEQIKQTEKTTHEMITDPRRASKWVEDSSVTKCFNCKLEFTTFRRIHHCRLCGRAFCYDCSKYSIKLPLDILQKIPDRPQSFRGLIWGDDDLNKTVRVCGTCFAYANKIIRIRRIIKVFELCHFTIRDLLFLSKLSQDWGDASKFLLSKFREIQYKLSIEEMSNTEKQMLWINRNFLTGHSRWLVQLVKATDLTNDYSCEILEMLMYKPKKNICWDTMCTRFCSETVEITDMLDLIRYNDNHPIVSNFIVKCLNSVESSSLINYLPFLTHNLKNNQFILDILLDKGISDFNFMSNLYWCIKVYSTDTNLRKEHIIKTLNEISKKTTSDFRRRFREMIKMEKLDIKSLHLFDNVNKIVLPICHNKSFIGVDSRNVKIMSSNSQPAIIYFYEHDGKKKPIMYKNDDVRKDYIILNIIDIIHDILKKEEDDLDIDIVRYEVMPTSKNTGYIEIVENASTIFNIIENSGLTIQNYILNHNKDQVIATFRERFIKSTALYCVVSYLLGIGDRHLDNIMISQDGLLFHIDFGFILGQDPKYSNNRLIRVTPEIINVIGGHGTDDYEYFKKTCVRIYNRLRLHVNLFSNLLSIVPSVDPKITVEDIKRELTERFEIGENCLEAATHMDNKVDSKNNFEYVIIDFLYKAKQSPLFRHITYLKQSITGAFSRS